MKNSRLIFDNLCSLKKHIIFIIVIVCVLSMWSCASSRISNPNPRIAIDTVYLTSRQYDSIYVFKNHSMEYRPDSQSRIANPESLIVIDTVLIRDTSIEYRYNLVRDTIIKSRIDSIPYEVRIETINEVPRPLSWFDHLTRAIFWLLCGILIIKIYGKIRG